MFGGRAYSDGVAFYTDEVWVKASRGRKRQIQVEIKRISKGKSHFKKKVNRIPVVRGLWMMAENTFRYWKMYIAVSLAIYCFTGAQIYMGNFDWILQSNAADGQVQVEALKAQMEGWAYLFLAVSIPLAFFGVRVSKVGRYHGAEHKTAEAYQQHGKLCLSQIRAASRVSRYCGSNMMVFMVVIFALFAVMQMPLWANTILSYALALEVFLLNERGFLVPFYWVAAWIQSLFLAVEPSEEELEVAITAYQTLLEVSD